MSKQYEILTDIISIAEAIRDGVCEATLLHNSLERWSTPVNGIINMTLCKYRKVIETPELVAGEPVNTPNGNTYIFVCMDEDVFVCKTNLGYFGFSKVTPIPKEPRKAIEGWVNTHAINNCEYGLGNIYVKEVIKEEE